MATDHITGYLNRLQLKDFSPNTLDAYRRDLRQAEKALGMQLHQADADDLEAFVASLHRAGAKGTTIRRKQAAMRGFFEHLQRKRVRDDDPTKAFEAPKLERRQAVFLNAGQVETMLATLGTESPAALRERAIVNTFYFTGARLAELVALDVEDLLFEERQLRVFGKGRKERWIPMSDQLVAVLRDWLAVHPTGAGPLFVTVRGERGRVGRDAVAKVVKAVYARAGIDVKKFSTHKLRHTFATRLVNRKVSIDKIQKLMGHASIETTTRYAQTDVGADMADTLTRALGSGDL
jgi:integrase/recombinase XerD